MTTLACLPSTIADAADALARGALSAVELTRAALDRADALDRALGVYVTRTDAPALEAAARVDAARAAGTSLGPLAGIPLGIKDIVATADAPTTAQSLVLDPGFGGGEDASVVARLRAAGAVLTGKTTTMEFAIGCPDPATPFPLPRNPWRLDRWAGGSSSGTASGVAAGLFLGGIGTDTGGSIRLPAAWCGVTGLKPTFGLVPRTGVVPLTWSLDHVGPIARTARDCALLLDAIAGHDPADSGSAVRPAAPHAAALDGNARGLRVGVDRAAAARAEPEVAARLEEALAVLAETGAEVIEVTVPLAAEVRTAATLCVCAEAFAIHRDLLRRRWSSYGASTRRTIATGALLDAADLLLAERVRRAAARSTAALLREVDLVVGPTSLCGPPALDDLDFGRISESVVTQGWNALGLPAASVPMGRADGVPCGLQIAGRAFEDATVLRLADAFQRLTGHHADAPAGAEGGR